MGRRTAFAEVLDEKLGTEAPPRQTLSGAYGYRATVHAFHEFAAAATPVTGWRPRHPYAAATAPQEARRTPRPDRRLSPGARAALDQLNALGARVSADFTPEELRTAFRSLALTFHPDRHPGSTSSDVARLSANFIAVNDAYRALQTTTTAA
ncbi:MAG: J domain-containing protein [Vicinamibacterales bacterium]